MKKKFALWGMVLLVLLVSSGIYYVSLGTAVNVLEVQPGTIANLIDEEGNLVPEVEYSLYASFGGEILELPVKEGQTVQAGELLAVIDAAELEFQLKQLQAQLKALEGEEALSHPDPPQAQINSQELLVEQARQNFNTAEKELERIEQLYREGAVTQQELESAQNALENARIMLQQQLEALALLEEASSPTKESRQYFEAQREVLKAQMDLLNYQLGKSRIEAPVDGVIANLTVNQGDFVVPGYKLMTVFQPDSYQVETYVLADSLEGINESMSVKLKQNRQGEDIVFSGQVSNIAPTAVEQISSLGLKERRVKITITPDLPEDIRLVPGTQLDVEFAANLQEGVLTVPKTALFTYQDGDALWIVKDGKAKIQPVETGLENKSDVVITRGLEAGDLVILNPQAKGLKEGKKVSYSSS